MSLLSAAADDEDGDTINALRVAVQQACDWISEEPSRRPISAGHLLAILTNALAAAPLLPSDHCEQHLDMVPAVPTASMMNEWCDAECAASPHLHQSDAMKAGYRAMLDAAPQPPTAEDSSVVVQPQGEQKPVGEAGPMPVAKGFTMACFPASDVPVGTKLYAVPQPKREPLTDEQIAEVLIDETNGRSTGIGFKTLRAFAQAIERAHGIRGEA